MPRVLIARLLHAAAPTPPPKPVAAPSPVKVMAPMRKVYNPMAPPAGRVSAQQGSPDSAGASPSKVLPDILQQLMPRPSA